MPVDSSIYSLIQQPKIASPMDAYGGALQIKSLIDQQGLHGLQRQQLEKTMADDQAVSQAYMESAGDPVKLRDLLAQRGQYKAVQAVEKALLDRRDKEASIGEKETATTLKRNQMVGGALIAAHADPSNENLDRIFANLRGAGVDVTKTAQSLSGVADPEARRRIIQSYAFQTPEGLAALKAIQPDIDWQDVGNRKLPIQKNPMAAGFGGQTTGVSPLAKAATPGEMLTDARSRESIAQTTGQNQVNNENKLRDDFNKASGQFVQVRDAHQRVLESARDPSAAGDLALIFNYMKVLDPGSTVREGEFATAQNAGSVESRITAMYNRVLNGERLAPEIRKDFVNRSQRLYEGAVKNQEGTETEYERIAQESNARPQNVVVKQRVKGSAADLDKPAAPKDPAKQKTFDALPDPAKFSGRKVRADDGTIYKSNGTSWVRE